MNKKFQLTDLQATIITVVGIAFMIWIAFFADFQVLVKF